ncbi:MAG TPA: CHAT domain-containing protein [Candidatus Limnocylindrales bacterium]|nr:CHAT domain-containing protein [Candidatus Limnocylindrales bacterium]
MGAPDLETLISAIAAEPNKALRQKLYSASPDLLTPDVVSRLYEASVRLLRVELAQSERVAEAVYWISKKVDDPAARALGLRAIGHIEYTKGHHEPALKCYQGAIDIYDKEDMEVAAGRTMSGGLQALIYLGRYDEAFAWADRARGIFSRHGDRLRLARLDVNIANVLYRLDRFDEALDLYRRAYAEFTTIGDPQDVAITLKNMATCQISLNDFRQALETYHAAREFCLKHDLSVLVAEADYNIAYLYYLRGEYATAIELYSQTREHCVELGDQYHQGLCDLDQSEMYLELNLSEEGAFLAERGLETFRHLGMGYEAAKATTNLAIAASHHGDAQQALELFRAAREIFVHEGNTVWTAMIDLYQALVIFQEGRFEDARTLCERALDFFSDSPLTGKAVLCELLLARIHLGGGRLQEAREICESALRRLEQTESPALAYQGYFVLGTVEEAMGDSAAALRAYRTAHERLENLRSHLKTEEMKIAFLKDKLSVYESLVRLCLERGNSPAEQELAFTYIEQAKSRSLADLIASRGNRLPNPRQTHRALIEQVGSLREELTWYTRALQSIESGNSPLRPAHIERLRRAARECEQRLVTTMTTLRAEDPEFANLDDAHSIELEAIRSTLTDEALLLQYYRVKDTFYACLLSRKDLKIVPLGAASDVRRVLQLLRFQLSKFRLGPEYIRTFQPLLLEAASAHLRGLYDALIAPIARDLRQRHLIVAPHEFLHYLPFHALMDESGGFLGDRHSISYTPSASVYYLCCTKNVTASEGALILGVPDPSAPQILEETRAVASVLSNAEVYLGPQATDRVLRERGAHCRYIHIATHGWFRQDNPMFSSIGLGNTHLSLFDLYQVSLPAELVTLSGCGTGLNVVVGGDELLGLKRGLLYAGAQSILVTLWDVNDQSTADFMKLFYQHLKSNGNKAAAVQSAMAGIRERYPHPFYWAPFVLVGKY